MVGLRRYFRDDEAGNLYPLGFKGGTEFGGRGLTGDPVIPYQRVSEDENLSLV
jgi:hypothetical protein